MKTMNHFCDNCLNYCSKWMAHLGWSLLSAGGNRQLLSFICFVPCVQHWTALRVYSLLRTCMTALGLRWSMSAVPAGGWLSHSTSFQPHCSGIPAVGPMHGATPAEFSLCDLPRQFHHLFIWGHRKRVHIFMLRTIGEGRLWVGVQVLISSSSYFCGEKGVLYWIPVSEDHSHYEKHRYCLILVKYDLLYKKK